jgi:DNA excision repair protein ERCC-2
MNIKVDKMMIKDVKVSVRNLIEFIYRSGDIDSRYNFGANRAQEGTKIHQYVQKSLKDQYKVEEAEFISEMVLKHTTKFNDLHFFIEGRADGVLIKDNKATIIEIKSTYKELFLLEENHNFLHWAQAKCYGYIYGMQNSLKNVDVELLYCNIESLETKSFTLTFSIEELDQFFNEVLQRYYHWANFSSNWIETRNFSIEALEFPFSKYRLGQRELAVSVFKTIREGKKLYAQAPTGIGKTVSTAFPALKALNGNKVDRIFYLTAKTSTRTIAENTINLLSKSGLKLKTTTITSKEKICFKERTECNPDYCEYAKGHYDRVNSVLYRILSEKHSFTRECIEAYSREYIVCPFELSLDLTLWSDFIICDYNYLFDPRVYLKRFFLESNESYIFLVDEAHNLVDRSREMFSAEIDKESVLKLKNTVKDLEPKIYKCLNKVNSYMVKLRKQCTDTNNVVIDEPKDFYSLLKNAIEAFDVYLAKGEQISIHEEILDVYFSMITFIKISEFYNENYTTYAVRNDQNVKLKLFCINPSKMIKQSLQKGKSTIFFSATMSPINYFKEVLGGNKDDYTLRLPSPFSIENRKILIGHCVNTRYNYRERSYDTISSYIYHAVSSYPGNYMVFFPSYAYMQSVYNVFTELYPKTTVLIQESNMADEEREEFLSKFDNRSENLIAFCVLGGSFSEGIDLIGDRLIGSIIVGVGLPQICFERKLIEEYYNNNSNFGFHYAYTFPGINKVIQAAGRVIRTEHDRGIILLLDDRFDSDLYQKIIPEEWIPHTKLSTLKELETTLIDFKKKSME